VPSEYSFSASSFPVGPCKGTKLRRPAHSLGATTIWMVGTEIPHRMGRLVSLGAPHSKCELRALRPRSVGRTVIYPTTPVSSAFSWLETPFRVGH
jgi:hypothetical protein